MNLLNLLTTLLIFGLRTEYVLIAVSVVLPLGVLAVAGQAALSNVSGFFMRMAMDFR